ncbi:Fused nickel transport protein NikMN [Acaryochloris thomasi RCC1774]|uniref:Fused nickel transport protein NikMN n=1 Tax=Acaryochloris thomasi RCC1774 TaxID=1764569 RepID=A0A2W1JT71_9CYAN|nr:cobalt transporter CbiM [Acaryochloris thomasi]PZD74315.1 Fused nickel transport protein NikMN [Acaryochloris thomasi RCC1774]
MHISDGLLPAKVCLIGYAITGGLTWYSLRQINHRPTITEEIPKASLLTAAFFAASAIRFPVPPASVHFVFNGALGAVLDCYAFPAVLVGLFFQALVFGHGGLTTLGINAVIMGLPAILAARIFRVRQWVGHKSAWSTNLFAFLAGAFGIGLSALLFYGLVIMTIPADVDAALEQQVSYGLLVAHIPLVLLEGTFTALLVSFLTRMKPEVIPE